MPAENQGTGKRLRRAKLALGTAAIAVAIAGVFLYSSPSPSELKTPPLAIDWRFKLTIRDAGSGADYAPPPNIGVAGELWFNHTLDRYGPKGYAPLSTRDSTGTVYVQSTVCDNSLGGFCPTFTLGDFFNIWGQQFDRRCVPDGRGAVYCGGQSGDPNPPPVMSDGQAERCVDRSAKVSDGKDWLIIIGSLTSTLQCG